MQFVVGFVGVSSLRETYGWQIGTVHANHDAEPIAADADPDTSSPPRMGRRIEHEIGALVNFAAYSGAS